MRGILGMLAVMVMSQPGFASGTGCVATGMDHLISALAQQTNQARSASGQAPLSVDMRLNKAAQRHACDLARRQTVSHRDRLGRRSMARVKRAGFRACFSAENVAMGTNNPRYTVGAWQGSPGHARNQQDPRARAMGFGVAKDGNGHLYWVGLYATTCQVMTAQRQSGLRPFAW